MKTTRKFAAPLYVPILKMKEGEVEAIRALANVPGYIPLLEVVPAKADNDAAKSEMTFDNHMEKQRRRLQSLIDSFGGGALFNLPPRPLWLDTSYVQSERTLQDQSAISALASVWRNTGLHVVPVVDLYAGQSHLTEIRNAVHEDECGLVIRMPKEALESRAIRAELNSLLGFFQQVPDDVDLVIDLSALPASQQMARLPEVQSLLRRIPLIENYRSVTLAATGFPAHLRAIEKDKSMKFARTEWSLWKALRQQPNEVPRLPAFGDYAITHPTITQNSGGGKAIPTLRYTLAEEWIIYRGDKTSPDAVYRPYCQKLIKDGYFRGPHTPADKEIKKVAEGRLKPPIPSMWRKIGTGQHIPFVLSQLGGHTIVPDPAPGG